MKQLIDLRSVALSPILSGRAPYSEIVRAARAAGFERVRLATAPAVGTDIDSHYLAEGELRELMAVLGDSGVSILDVGPFELAPDADLTLARSKLGLAAELGASFLCCVGAAKPGAHHFLSQQRVDDFGKICDDAAQLGIAVALEYTAERNIACFEDASNLIKAAGRANAAPVLDILDFALSGYIRSESLQLPEQSIAFAKLSESARARFEHEFSSRSSSDPPVAEGRASSLGSVLAMLPPDICLAMEARLFASEPAVHLRIDSAVILDDCRTGPMPVGRDFAARYIQRRQTC